MTRRQPARPSALPLAKPGGIGQQAAMDAYYRPLVRHDQPRPDTALPLAGGPGWFTEAALHRRGAEVIRVDQDAIPDAWKTRLTLPRTAVAGMPMDRVNLMGILNVTPDSFSDGGRHKQAVQALAHARDLAAGGAHIIDIGGESTRPGAQTVPAEAEIARIEPVFAALDGTLDIPVSIDTRKSAVAEVAAAHGAGLINDVSGFTYDPMLAHFAARKKLAVCVMHARGDPETMHHDPRYGDVLLDVFDFLADQVAMLAGLGVPRDRIIVDPGIGFGKNTHHNLALLTGLSLFHGLGCALLLGASRKGFIGQISGASPAAARGPGSVAVALHGAREGAQILRVHDVAETAQALALWQALRSGEYHDP